MWLLGNLFRTKTRLGAFSRYSVQQSMTDVMPRTENYGILGDTIPVAAESSDFFAEMFNLGPEDPMLLMNASKPAVGQTLVIPVGCTSVSCRRRFSLQMRLLLPG
jgi:hypothetical protein